MCDFNNRANGSNGSACGGSPNYDDGRDVFYLLEPTTDINVRVRCEDNRGGDRGAIWLFNGCPTSGGTCLAFTAAETLDADFAVSLAAGNSYFIMIDGFVVPGCMDEYTLTVEEFSSALTGDTCANPFIIDVGSLPFTDARTDMCSFNNTCTSAPTAGCGGRSRGPRR